MYVLIISLYVSTKSAGIFTHEFTSYDKCMIAGNSIKQEHNWNSHNLQFVCTEK